MEWIENFNRAINYLEEHMTEEIDYDEAAKVAGCSIYHFQRMFAYMANSTLTEYVRRRRMSLAAVELQNSDIKIIDLALKYGYNSPTAFNRAFQSIHGVAPSAVREQGVTLRAYPPISFKMIIKGAEEMNYRIEKKEAFRIVGIGAKLYKEIEKNFEVVPQMWGKAVAEGILPKLAAMMDAEPKGILGVSAYHETEDSKYYIAVATTQPAGEEFEEYIVPSFTWAVFPGTGSSQEMQEFEKRIVTEWLPTSGYEYDNGPDVEVYLNPDPANATYEVWIPVKQAAK